ncbi:uncharacterized protein LOC126299120 isoform X1 [Schistocerca gregaria]|uniref:uncharacterized protein LOC126299120 isoform X1 n=1 Tax=Schistocerca gregaria TaxID=7010 RepID=UPI00211EA2C8|nr:uncharacterized protein LOC126299120 isoform X1 [Schistocerca gregaria]
MSPVINFHPQWKIQMSLKSQKLVFHMTGMKLQQNSWLTAYYWKQWVCHLPCHHCQAMTMTTAFEHSVMEFESYGFLTAGTTRIFVSFSIKLKHPKLVTEILHYYGVAYHQCVSNKERKKERKKERERERERERENFRDTEILHPVKYLTESCIISPCVGLNNVSDEKEEQMLKGYSKFHSLLDLLLHE